MNKICKDIILTIVFFNGIVSDHRLELQTNWGILHFSGLFGSVVWPQCMWPSFDCLNTNNYNIVKIKVPNTEWSTLWINHFRGMLYWVIQARDWEIVRKVNIKWETLRTIWKPTEVVHSFYDSTITNKSKTVSVRSSARDMHDFYYVTN